ncbi:MAG: hypothetical protein MJ231_05485 [bacterium]|nr:hypothetical protein [bacterium]
MNPINVNYSVNFCAKLGPNISNFIQKKGSGFYRDVDKAKEIIKRVPYEVADIVNYKGVGDVVTLDGKVTKQQLIYGPDHPSRLMQFAEIIKAEAEKSDIPVRTFRGVSTVSVGEVVKNKLNKCLPRVTKAGLFSVNK